MVLSAKPLAQLTFIAVAVRCVRRAPLFSHLFDFGSSGGVMDRQTGEEANVGGLPRRCGIPAARFIDARLGLGLCSRTHCRGASRLAPGAAA